MDDGALQVVHSCMTALQSLVESLLEGHVLLGDLQACLKYKDQFKRLYQQCMHRTVRSQPFTIASFICPGEETVSCRPQTRRTPNLRQVSRM